MKTKKQKHRIQLWESYGVIPQAALLYEETYLAIEEALKKIPEKKLRKVDLHTILRMMTFRKDELSERTAEYQEEFNKAVKKLRGRIKQKTFISTPGPL